jgi:hypothetical protein
MKITHAMLSVYYCTRYRQVKTFKYLGCLIIINADINDDKAEAIL